MSPIVSIDAKWKKIKRRWKKLPESERSAIVVSIAALVIVVVLAVLLRLVGIRESAALIAIIALPLIIYGVASGKVQEFNAPGGWGATFREAANDEVEPVPITQAIQDVEIVRKGGLRALKQAGQRLDSNKPVALTLELGRRGYYSQHAIKAYVETLSLVDPNMTVLLVEGDGKFVAMAEATSVIRALDNDIIASNFLHAIETGDRMLLMDEVGFVDVSVGQNATNVEALSKMQSENLHSIVVVDGNSRPKGIVRRDDIVARLLVKLAAPKTAV